MKNEIPEMKEDDLIIPNYAGQLDRQMSIYLFIDWENDKVYVDQRNFSLCGTPAPIHYGLVWIISLPGDVDAELLRSDVEKLISKFEEIKKGWSKEWDGNNYIGRYTEEIEEMRYSLGYQIEIGQCTHLLDEERYYEYLFEKEIIEDP